MKKYRIARNRSGHQFKKGTIVWVDSDDGSKMPWMTDGKESWYVYYSDLAVIYRLSVLPSRIVSTLKGWFHK